MPKGVPLTEDQMAAKRHEIAEAAKVLFVSNGYAETSMRGIAGAAGLGKSTLYDYFEAKDDVLAFILEEEIGELIKRGMRIVDGEGPAPDRLQSLMRMHLEGLLQSRALFLQILAEGQKLRPDSLKRIQACRYAYQDLVRALVEEGIEAGEFRRVNAAMATKLLISLMTPVVYTSRPAGTPDEMLDDALDIVTGGLLK